MIRSIHYLRGLAALLVVCFHFRAYLNDISEHSDWGERLFASGAFGVDLFFIISGFIICFATRRTEPRLLLSYVLKRVFRIYPLLICSLLFFYFAFDHQDQSLLRSLVPLHADYSKSGPFFGYNLLSPVWTLTYELFFYGLFFIALALSHKHRKEVGIGLVVLLFVGFQWGLYQGIDLSAYQKVEVALSAGLEPIVAVFSSPMILEFVYGMLIYMVYERLPEKPPAYAAVLSIVLIGLAILATIGLFSDFFYGHGPLRWGLPAALLVVALLVYEKFNGIAKISFLLWLGDISFSLYLTHILLIKWLRKYELITNLSGASVFAIAVLLSLLLSTVAYVLIEKQGIRLCRDLLSKRKLRSTQLGVLF